MHAFVFALLIAQSSADFGAEPQALQTELAAQVAAAFDSSRGGFVRSYLPNESAVELALQRSGDHAAGDWLHQAETTLSWMHGLMDTLTGGYVHNGNLSESETGTLDKRADSNGRRLELLVMAWRATGDEAYRHDAARVVDWAERVLLDGRGGFVTAQVGDRELEPAANGTMIHAWLTWAAENHDRRRRNFALQSLDRVWEECSVQPLGLVRKNEMGDIAREPQLLDQVEMGRAYLLAGRLCGRPQDRERARALGELIIKRFQEPSGGFRTQSVPSKNGSIRKARCIAGENARAARFLCELAALTGDTRYRVAAGHASAPFKKEMAKAGLEAADWALAVRASYDADLPGPGNWVAEAAKDQDPPRKRSVRFKLGH